MDEQEQGAGATRELDLLISRVLRRGIAASVGLLTLGMALTLVSAYRAGATTLLDSLASGGATLSEPAAVVRGLAAGNPLAILYLGLLVLAVLPLAPVVLSLAASFRQRDRAYLAITVSLLVILALSLAIGLGT